MTPVEESGNKLETGLGPIGILVNGIAIFNALDGMSYNNQGIWNRNAHYWELAGMDSCNGHPAPLQGGGPPPQFDQTVDESYHHHFYSFCLADLHFTEYDNTVQSPIMGFSFDGFPIYGPYDFGDSQSIERMRSSYQL
ncbi:MAG: YHYH protein [Candidatus Heimdallarchaeota archaeon]|nr:YHYH protein [Candidatus Heimdallarchaeota archaeon]